jgi:hypothetical protein
MFIPASRGLQAQGEDSQTQTSTNITIGETTTTDRFIPMVQSYVYLGYLLHSSLSDAPAIRARISSALSLFGSLRKDLLGTKEARKEVKRTVFVGMVIPMLLYGAEVWITTSALQREINTAYRRMVRAMMRVNLKTTRLHRISHTHLLGKMGLDDIQSYMD